MDYITILNSIKKLTKNDKEKLLEKLLVDLNMKKCEICKKFLPKKLKDRFHICKNCGANFCDDCNIDDDSMLCVNC